MDEDTYLIRLKYLDRIEFVLLPQNNLSKDVLMQKGK